MCHDVLHVTEHPATSRLWWIRSPDVVKKSRDSPYIISLGETVSCVSNLSEIHISNSQSAIARQQSDSFRGVSFISHCFRQCAIESTTMLLRARIIIFRSAPRCITAGSCSRRGDSTDFSSNIEAVLQPKYPSDRDNCIKRRYSQRNCP